MTYYLLDSDGIILNIYIADKPLDSSVPALVNVNAIVGDSYYNLHAKQRRKELLANADWTQSPDSPLTDAKKAEWATYRQALRDITDQSGYPMDINWPEEPN